MRIGIGYDIHRLSSGRRLVLGGVEIPYGQGLEGHSDADVLCHAICDALIGGCALGDIGTHFPNSDTAYKGISGLVLLREVLGLLRSREYRIINVDTTIIAEQPKLNPFIGEMRKKVSDALNVKTAQVSVKACTNEGLDSLGQNQGIACHAVALIESI